jgi:hypothetical protein
VTGIFDEINSDPRLGYPWTLTAERLMAIKVVVDLAVENQRNADEQSGLCVCQPCFDYRNQSRIFGDAFGPPPTCLNSPFGRWLAEREALS